VGLQVLIGRLLALDWSRPHGPEARPIMHFIFDGGKIADGDGIVVQESELEGYRLTAPDELQVHLPPRGLARVAGALRALAGGTAVFLPHEISSPD
jgi:hypothetical protein